MSVFSKFSLIALSLGAAVGATQAAGQYNQGLYGSQVAEANAGNQMTG